MFPTALPEFFIRMLTDEGDTVLDPFGGSNTTGWVAESLERRWVTIDVEEDYVENSRFRWMPPPGTTDGWKTKSKLMTAEIPLGDQEHYAPRTKKGQSRK